MRRAGALVLLLGGASAVAAACAAFDADTPSAPEADASADGSIDDAAPFLPPQQAPYDAGVRCDPGAPFGPPTPLSGLSSYSVEAVRFGFNRQVVYLSLCPPSGDKTACDMYQGAANTTDGVVSLSALTGVNASGYDSYPTVTGNADTIIFGSSRAAPLRIYHANADGGVFGNPKLLPLGVTLALSNEPYLLADGRTFYFAGSANGGQWRLYRATGTSIPFGAPATIPELESAANELAPVPTEDELEIFFASGRQPGTNDNLEIWTARRRTTSEPFDAPTRLDGEFSSQGNDWPTWISPDACDFYFIKKADNVVGKAYVARRAKPGG